MVEGGGSRRLAVVELRRAVAWAKDDPFGAEFAEIARSASGLHAEGTAIGAAPTPYHLDYVLETDPDLATTQLRVTSRGEGWRRTLDLRRSSAGAWSIAAKAEGAVDLPPPGGDAASLAGARDCDLGLSPVTNLMPVLRHGLLRGEGPVELTMAWVSVPALTVQPDGQRYTFVRREPDRTVLRFEAIDGSFAADLTVDPDGIVIDYPGIARRLGKT